MPIEELKKVMRFEKIDPLSGDGSRILLYPAHPKFLEVKQLEEDGCILIKCNCDTY